MTVTGLLNLSCARIVSPSLYVSPSAGREVMRTSSMTAWGFCPPSILYEDSARADARTPVAAFCAAALRICDPDGTERALADV